MLVVETKVALRMLDDLLDVTVESSMNADVDKWQLYSKLTDLKIALIKTSGWHCPDGRII